MSRCFPYPPPGYLRQGLVESTKLESETVQSKSEKKLREKKDRKKERKQKEVTHDISKKLKKLDDCVNGYNDERLEKSEVTEEHGSPVCYLSDRTQDSNKRKREPETVSSRQCTVNGSIIRIRFSCKEKPQQPDARVEAVCSTSGREESSAQSKPQEQCYPSDKRAKTVTPVQEQKLVLDDEGTQQIPSGTSVYKNEKNETPKSVLQYKALVEDWVPPSFEFYNDDDEDDWLFMSKQQGKPAAKIAKVDNDVTCRVSATSWPKAHFLPEAEIYALPYAVPF